MSHMIMVPSPWNWNHWSSFGDSSSRKPTVELLTYLNLEKGEIILRDSVDISIAVATEKGLMTPIVRNADQKSIKSISSEVKQLAEKARAGKLAPNEFQGGTFSAAAAAVHILPIILKVACINFKAILFVDAFLLALHSNFIDIRRLLP
ncbi:hypothetical protein GH714_014213 [Hevea brasiliensis]|uniref:2-oxoacid dehydrogenase acyltransferase catalytic domain-containing protein n=1 Tax=Hevea brasiliensis TaxID=3981 RepID=A0A6A6L1R6_HEVBR|nr:hypothetical protein GH714_014213 [Hevea brasiliensis]